jgi:hypothetical protein
VFSLAMDFWLYLNLILPSHYFALVVDGNMESKTAFVAAVVPKELLPERIYSLDINFSI